MTRRVLLLQTPLDLGYNVFTPLALACIRAATPDGYSVDVRDLGQRRWTDIRATDFAPYDVIGLSLRYTYNDRKTKQFLRALADRFPDKVLVAGGPHATYDLSGMFAAGVGYVVRFAGERPWNDLLSALRDGKDPGAIPGVATADDPASSTDHDRPFADPNDDPIPTHEVFDPRDYPFPLYGSGASLETSRGCPNRCRFCTNPDSWRGRWVAKQIPRIVEEVERVQERGFGFAYLVDDNFGIDERHLHGMLEKLAARPKPLPFMVNMEPGTINRDPKLLDLAWRAGLRIAFLGTNTIDHRTLRMYDREGDADSARSALEALRQSPVSVVSNVMVGAPGESRETMRANVRFVQRHADVFTCGTLEPRPGSRFWTEADWDRTDQLAKGEPLLHENPRMVRRLIHRALLGYYFRPTSLLRAFWSRKIGTRVLFRLHYRMYAGAALRKFLGRDRTADPASAFADR